MRTGFQKPANCKGLFLISLLGKPYKETKLHNCQTHADGLGRSHASKLPNCWSSDQEHRSAISVGSQSFVNPWILQSLYPFFSGSLAQCLAVNAFPKLDWITLPGLNARGGARSCLS